jgi:hypothetical protein
MTGNFSNKWLDVALRGNWFFAGKVTKFKKRKKKHKGIFKFM